MHVERLQLRRTKDSMQRANCQRKLALPAKFGPYAAASNMSQHCHGSSHIPELQNFHPRKGRLSAFYMVYCQQLEKIGVQNERDIYEVKRFMDSVSSSSQEESLQSQQVAVVQSG